MTDARRGLRNVSEAVDLLGLAPEVAAAVVAALEAVPISSGLAAFDLLTAPCVAEDGRRSLADLLRAGELTEALSRIEAYGETGWC